MINLRTPLLNTANCLISQAWHTVPQGLKWYWLKVPPMLAKQKTIYFNPKTRVARGYPLFGQMACCVRSPLGGGVYPPWTISLWCCEGGAANFYTISTGYRPSLFNWQLFVYIHLFIDCEVSIVEGRPRACFTDVSSYLDWSWGIKMVPKHLHVSQARFLLCCALL